MIWKYYFHLLLLNLSEKLINKERRHRGEHQILPGTV